jgi:hypothetical protein
MKPLFLSFPYTTRSMICDSCTGEGEDWCYDAIPDAFYNNYCLQCHMGHKFSPIPALYLEYFLGLFVACKWRGTDLGGRVHDCLCSTSESL